MLGDAIATNDDAQLKQRLGTSREILKNKRGTRMFSFVGTIIQQELGKSEREREMRVELMTFSLG